MKIASVAEVRSQFSEFLKASAEGPIVVTRNGRPVAFLVGLQDDEETERFLMANSPRLKAILDRSRQQIRDGGGIGHEEFWNDVATSKPAAKRRKPRRKPA